MVSGAIREYGGCSSSAKRMRPEMKGQPSVCGDVVKLHHKHLPEMGLLLSPHTVRAGSSGGVVYKVGFGLCCERFLYPKLQTEHEER